MNNPLDRKEIMCPTCKGEGEVWVFDGMDSSVLRTCIHCHGKKTVLESFESAYNRVRGIAEELANVETVIACQSCSAHWHDCGLDMNRRSVIGCKLARIRAAASKATEAK